MFWKVTILNEGLDFIFYLLWVTKKEYFEMKLCLETNNFLIQS